MPVEFRSPEVRRGRPAGASETPFEVAFRTSRMAMILTDPRLPDNPITFANDAFSRLTGYSQDEVVGRNCRFLQGPQTDPRVVAEIGAALKRNEGIEAEILNYRKDGTPFWNCLIISPVPDEASGAMYFFASLVDVSDKKRAEFELQQAHADLERQVESRTQDLQSTLDQKTALLHEVNHRVKNNLQVISSLVLLKARRIGDDNARQALYNLAERISALSTVYRLLYAAEDASRFDLGSFVTDLSRDLIELLPPGQVELELQIDPTAVPAAKAAPLALLLNEILSNAVKHAFPERRRGRLSVKVLMEGQDIALTIADDGIGLESDRMHEGFGKTLIDLLVRQLRGSVTWSDAGPGTCVTVKLPMDRREVLL